MINDTRISSSSFAAVKINIYSDSLLTVSSVFYLFQYLINYMCVLLYN